MAPLPMAVGVLVMLVVAIVSMLLADPVLAAIGLLVVGVPVDQAFAAFTERFGDFKPPEHNLLKVDIAETVFEPKVGGFLYDRGVDGSVCRWARVLGYEPPSRLLLSWDISPRWQIEEDPRKVRFQEWRAISGRGCEDTINEGVFRAPQE